MEEKKVDHIEVFYTDGSMEKFSDVKYNFPVPKESDEVTVENLPPSVENEQRSTDRNHDGKFTTQVDEDWSSGEEDILRENFFKLGGVDTIMVKNLLPGRTKKQILTKAKHMGMIL